MAYFSMSSVRYTSYRRRLERIFPKRFQMHEDAGKYWSKNAYENCRKTNIIDARNPTWTSVFPPSNKAMAKFTHSSKILIGDSLMNNSTTRSLAPCLFNSFCVILSRSKASSSAIKRNKQQSTSNPSCNDEQNLSMVDEVISNIVYHRRNIFEVISTLNSVPRRESKEWQGSSSRFRSFGSSGRRRKKKTKAQATVCIWFSIPLYRIHDCFWPLIWVHAWCANRDFHRFV